MMQTKTKEVGTIFSDYETQSNIKYAKIEHLDVIKKTNTLGISLLAEEYIEIKEIWYLEKFLKQRFSFNNIDMTIKYVENVEIKSIEEEWKNIIAYMAHKYPLTKPMLLLKSNIEVKENIIDVKMHIKGADFLRAKKTDKELEKTIKKLFGKEYKVELEEECAKEEEEKWEERNKKQEEEFVKKAIENLELMKHQNAEPSVSYEENNMPPIPPMPTDEDYIPEERRNRNRRRTSIYYGKPKQRKRKFYKNKRYNSK